MALRFHPYSSQALGHTRRIVIVAPLSQFDDYGAYRPIQSVWHGLGCRLQTSSLGVPQACAETCMLWIVDTDCATAQCNRQPGVKNQKRQVGALMYQKISRVHEGAPRERRRSGMGSSWPYFWLASWFWYTFLD